MPTRKMPVLAAIAAITLLAFPAGVTAQRKKASPHVSVIGWSTMPLGAGPALPAGQTLRLCGVAATDTERLYVHLKFRGLHKGRPTKIKWTVNGLTYATTERSWALGKSGKAAADLGRAPTHTRFLSGLYRFSFVYAGKRLATSVLTVDTAC